MRIVMDEHTDQPPTKWTNAISDVIKAACRLADKETVRSVHVVSTRRPTYDELLHYRLCADTRNLDLTVDASGIAFRQHREAREVENAAGTQPGRSECQQYATTAVDPGLRHAEAPPRLSSALAWLRVHGAMWRAELSAMSEGTR